MKTTILYLLCLLPLVATAQQATTLTLSGKSATEVTPDITVINIALSAVDMDYSISMNLLQDKSKNIKNFLKKKGIDKTYIISENFNINKSYSYENRKQIFKGYNATLNLRLEFLNDNKLANKIINAIGESNAEADVNVSFKLSQDLKDKVNDQLIEEAINDAKKKGDIIAKATNMSLGQITKINYGVQENITVSPMMERSYMSMDMEMEKGSKNSLSITPQPVEKTTEIIIYWLLFQN